MIKSLFSAFLMYSRIPVPQVEWKEENRRYALCFFPLIGAVIGGAVMGVKLLAGYMGISSVLAAAVMTALPIVITGGIHADGFCDVQDALACCGSREKMLEVMSDSRVGAFALIKLSVYFILQLGLLCQAMQSELGCRVIGCTAVGFVLSRSLSGLAAVCFRSAKSGGSLNNFSRAADRRIVISSEIMCIILCCVGMWFIYPAASLGSIAMALASFVYYRVMSYSKFGGITGDLAGYFLQICELSVLAGAVLGDIIYGRPVGI